MDCFGIFAKYWEPGKVKTRLAATLGTKSAAEIYRQFVATLVQRFEEGADRRVLCFTPAEHAEVFAVLAGAHWCVQPQSTGDLGCRMASFFDSCFREGADRVVLIGSDSPSLPLDYVDTAFSLLHETDVVLGPTDDGGYYLVGTSQAGVGIFDEIDWSTPRVWEQTIARLSALRLSYESLPQWYDVDEADDLERLRLELSLVANDDSPLSRLFATINPIL